MSIIYTLDDNLRFGKYKGESLRDLVKKDISYVQWCIRTASTFYISSDTIQEIKEINSSFVISESDELGLDERLKNSKDGSHRSSGSQRAEYSLEAEANDYDQYLAAGGWPRDNG